jgi:hypothetical protein
MGDELVRWTREMFAVLALDKRVSRLRIRTDVSDPTFTVESEFLAQSRAAFEQIHAELMTGAAFAKRFARTQPLVEHSRRDFFSVVM